MMNIYKAIETFYRWCPNSVRQLSWLLEKPYETPRRFIKKLASKEARKAFGKSDKEMDKG